MNQSHTNEFRKFATGHLGISTLNLDAYSKIYQPKLHPLKPISQGTLNPSNMTPYIIEERQLNVAQMDVFSRLMMDRIIFLGTPIDDYIANIVNAQLLFLESVDAKKDITMYINSPGGTVYDGLGVYDVMQLVSPDVCTVNTGKAISMAYVLMCAGAKGKRMALPNSRFMQHQPLGGAQGQATDIEIASKEIQTLKKSLYEIISTHTGQPYEKVHADCERDNYMSAKEAKEYGCFDTIIKKRDDKKDKK